MSASGVGLVVGFPLLFLAAVLVKCTSPGPALFRQVRVGRAGKPFRMIKLRTMREGSFGPSVTAGGDARVTRCGQFLRRTKLDELPELWHVVTGTMSLVGPRPEVPAMVDLADSLWQKVLAVRPGITDPVTLALRNEEALLAEAQMRFGDLETFYRKHLQPWKLRQYVEYLECRTVWSDLRVLAKTAFSVANGKAPKAPELGEILMAGPSSGGVEMELDREERRDGGRS